MVITARKAGELEEARAHLKGQGIDAITVVAAEGRTWEFCGGGGMVEALESQLISAEDVSGPRVRAARGHRARAEIRPASRPSTKLE